MYHIGTQIKFDMTIISSREFRQNQKKYFEKIDNGEQIIVQRGKDKSYTITAVNDEDLLLDNHLLKKLRQSLKEIENGESKKINTPKQISDLLGL